MIKSLQSLRFVAACAIFLHHLAYLEQADRFAFLYTDYFSKWYFGVSFFFVLSGFVLSISDSSQWTHSKFFRFFRNRILRFYPIHIATFVASLPLVYRFSTPSAAMWIANLSLLQSFVPNILFYFSFNSVSWFLSDLLFFSFCFPVLIYVYTKMRIPEMLKVAIYGGVIGTYMYIYGLHYGQTQNIHWFFYISPFWRIIDFVSGMVFGFLYLQTKKYAGILSYRSGTLLEICSVFLFILAVVYAYRIPLRYQYAVYYVPVLSVVVYVFALSKGALSKIMEHTFLVKLGNIGFGFIMSQSLLIWYGRTVTQERLYMHPIISTLLLFILSLGAGMLLTTISTNIKNKSDMIGKYNI